MGAPLVASALRPIDAVLTNSASAMSATRLLKEGAVASIPATATSVELFSLSRQDSLSFTLSKTQIRTASALSIEFGSGVETFDLSSFHNAFWPQPIPGQPLENLGDLVTADMADLADLLNSGEISVNSADNRTLKDFGLFASGSGGNLTFSSAVPSGTPVLLLVVLAIGLLLPKWRR